MLLKINSIYRNIDRNISNCFKYLDENPDSRVKIVICHCSATLSVIDSLRVSQ